MIIKVSFDIFMYVLKIFNREIQRWHDLILLEKYFLQATVILKIWLGLWKPTFNTVVILLIQKGLLEQMPTHKHSTSTHRCLCFIRQCPWEHICVTRATPFSLMEWNIVERILLNKKSVLLLDLAGSMMLKTLPNWFEKYSSSDVCLNNYGHFV